MYLNIELSLLWFVGVSIFLGGFNWLIVTSNHQVIDN